MIKNIYCAGWQWGLLLVFSAAVATHRPPHILFIMVDDMGWNDVSFHGSDQILTPNIDVLAYNSVILQQYYSEAICTPARTALLTGKYPMRLGMHGFPLYNAEDRGIPPSERLLPSYMKDMGYSTHLVGKWHVGMSRKEYLPTFRGYDTHYGFRGGVIDYYTYNKVESWPDGRVMFGLDLFDNLIPQENERQYIIDALTDRAVEIIQDHNSSVPLFLHMAHNAPHAGNTGGALQPPLYKNLGNRHIAESNRRLYADIVSHLDTSIGKLLRALKDKNILDDTLIVFVSDNGAPTTGEYGNWGVNLPLRGKKNTPWEGGSRVPAFVWHSSFKPTVWNGLMHITDWLPTLIAAAGGNTEVVMDGVNQWDSIKENAESKRKEVLIAIEDSSSNAYASYRLGDYKIVIGNVSGVSNGYYGLDLLVNKDPPPSYFTALRSCDVANMFTSMGVYLDRIEIEKTRKASTITQLDTVRDSTPCVPSLIRGCLFNVKKDPTESHDLWQSANKIAILLTNRLKTFWLEQKRRSPLELQIEADPANFDYVWQPWANNITESYGSDSDWKNKDFFPTSHFEKTFAKVVQCDGQTGIRNFLCILRSIF